MIKLVKNEFFIYCKETRIESNRSFYGSFSLGPFDAGQSITIANALRRTLLSELKGLAITSAEIEGAFHEYSTLPGVRDSILDILLNLKDIVLKSVNYGNKKKGTSYATTFKNKQIGYLKTRGPGIVTASELKLPPGIQCVDPDQYIATLSEEGILNMKIHINEGKNYVIQSSYLDQNLLKKEPGRASDPKQTLPSLNLANNAPNLIRTPIRIKQTLSHWNSFAPFPLVAAQSKKTKKGHSIAPPKVALLGSVSHAKGQSQVLLSSLEAPYVKKTAPFVKTSHTEFNYGVTLFFSSQNRPSFAQKGKNVKKRLSKTPLLVSQRERGQNKFFYFKSKGEAAQLQNNWGIGVLIPSDKSWKEPLIILKNFMQQSDGDCNIIKGRFIENMKRKRLWLQKIKTPFLLNLLIRAASRIKKQPHDASNLGTDSIRAEVDSKSKYVPFFTNKRKGAVSFYPKEHFVEGGLDASKALPLAIDAVFMPVNKVNYIIETNEQSVMLTQISNLSSAPFLIPPWYMNLTATSSAIVNHKISTISFGPFCVRVDEQRQLSWLKNVHKKGSKKRQSFFLKRYPFYFLCFFIPKGTKRNNKNKVKKEAAFPPLSLPAKRVGWKQGKRHPLKLLCKNPTLFDFFEKKMGEDLVSRGVSNYKGFKILDSAKREPPQSDTLLASREARPRYARSERGAASLARPLKLLRNNPVRIKRSFVAPNSGLLFRSFFPSKNLLLLNFDQRRAFFEGKNDQRDSKRGTRINAKRTVGFFFKSAAARNLMSAQLNKPSFSPLGLLRSLQRAPSGQKKQPPKKEGPWQKSLMPFHINEGRQTLRHSPDAQPSEGLVRCRARSSNMTLKTPQTKTSLKNNIILEIWTNGSIHPRQALYESCKNLLSLFSKLEKATPLAFSPNNSDSTS